MWMADIMVTQQADLIGDPVHLNQSWESEEGILDHQVGSPVAHAIDPSQACEYESAEVGVYVALAWLAGAQ